MEIKEAISKINTFIEVWELEQADVEIQMIIYKEDIEALKIAIELLEKQTFFENTVGTISDWFVDNKDCLLDAAMKVARDGFIENSMDDSIDEVDLDSIVEDIVDEIQTGILNVLSTFIKN